MAGRCTVCSHIDRKAIDAAFAVSTVRAIAGRYTLSKSAVASHKLRHLEPAVARAIARREDLGAEALLDKLFSIADSLEAAFDDALKNNDHLAVARLSKELRETIVRLGQATRGLWSTTSQTLIDNRRQTVNLSPVSLEDLRNLAKLASGEIPSAILGP
jgi:hypothetical protein